MENFSFHKKTETLEEVNTRKGFEHYQKYFHLTEEELKKPLLDVGAGNAAFVQYLRNVLGNKQAYGVELYPGKLTSSEEGVVAGDGLNLPFKDESFELVITKDYLPMFVDVEEKMQKALFELLRVTKPGGKIMGNISTPEGEIRSQKNEIRRNSPNNEKTLSWIDQRIEGSKNLQTLLESLREEGYIINLDAKSPFNRVIIIQKP